MGGRGEKEEGGRRVETGERGEDGGWVGRKTLHLPRCLTLPTSAGSPSPGECDQVQ